MQLPSSLRARAILLLLVALIPTAFVALAASYAAYRHLVDNERAGLRTEAEQLGFRLDAIWLVATRLGHFIAEQSGWQPDFKANCAAQLGALLSYDDRYREIAVYRAGAAVCRVRRDGAVIAAADGTVGVYTNLAPDENWLGMISDGRANTVTVAVNAMTRDQEPTIAVIRIDPDFIVRILGRYGGGGRGITALVTPDRGVISTRPEREFPTAWQTALRPESRLVSLRGDDGTTFEIASRKLAGFDAWLMIALPTTVLLASPRVQIVAAIVTLVLMMAVTAATVWFGLFYLILRWVREIAARTNAYAGGDLSARIGPCVGAPKELALLARHFDSITDRMAVRTLEQEREVTKQQGYLRNLHHHVKNTLQIASSLIGLQMRTAPGYARAVLRFPFDRINAVSAAYAAGSGQGEPNHVAISRLTTEVVDRLCQGSPHTLIAPRYTFTEPDAEIDLIAARTLAMLLAELTPTYIDEAGRTGGTITIHVDTPPGRWRIEIHGPRPAEATRDPLSSRLLSAHLRHLSATFAQNPSGSLVVEFQRA